MKKHDRTRLTQRLEFKVSEGTKHDLTQERNKTGNSIASIIRKAISEYIERVNSGAVS